MKHHKQSFRTFHRIVVTLLVLIVACGPKIKPATPIPAPLSPTVPPPSPILSFTPFPTMSPDIQFQLYDLLKNNGGCDLPCFLDMTPGKTSWQEAESFLEMFAQNRPLHADRFASTSTLKVYIAEIFTNYGVTLDGNVRSEVDTNNLVQHIIFTVEITTKGVTETRDKHLSWYSLSEIFKRYGPPDVIYIDYTDRGLDYAVEIIYEKQELVIQYGGLARLNADRSYTMCPNLGDGDVSYMKLAVANPVDPEDIKTLMGYPFWEGATSLEDASGMHMDEFYRLMTGDHQPVCFQVK